MWRLQIWSFGDSAPLSGEKVGGETVASSFTSPFGRLFQCLSAGFGRWRTFERSRHELTYLNAHLLRDIGLEQNAADRETGSFWDR